jgi:hypothetical protein
MKKSLNSGFILAESLIGFGVLATCVLLFLAMQTASLTQSAALQEKAQVLYEEVQNHSFDASTITYTTQRQTVYQVRFWQAAQHQQARIQSGEQLWEIVYEE